MVSRWKFIAIFALKSPKKLQKGDFWAKMVVYLNLEVVVVNQEWRFICIDTVVVSNIVHCGLISYATMLKQRSTAILKSLFVSSLSTIKLNHNLHSLICNGYIHI